MPQLMPLYWIFSVIMIFLILVLLVDVYYLIFVGDMSSKENSNNGFNMSWWW